MEGYVSSNKLLRLRTIYAGGMTQATFTVHSREMDKREHLTVPYISEDLCKIYF